MYGITPEPLYAHEDLFAMAGAAQRIARFEQALGTKAIPYRDEDVPTLPPLERWANLRVRCGELDAPPDPGLILTRGRFQPDPQIAEILGSMPPGKARSLAGEILSGAPFSFFQSGHDTYRAPRPDHVCRPAWRITTARGCQHRCAYCGLGGVITALANVEEFVDHLDRLIAHNPWQRTYLLNDAADTLALEPEWGCFRALTEYFGRLEDRYLIIHTKSANVDFTLDLPHRGRVVLLWTVTSPRAAEVFEPGAPSTEERLRAARKCQEAGYPIRLKFKPIIPIQGWREDGRRLIEMVLEYTRPEVINLFTLAWMTVEEVDRAFRAAELDPEVVGPMRERPDRTRTGPLPHDVRARIYDFYIDTIRALDPQVPIAFSTESLEMWRDFSEKLGYGPADYICGCGAQARPGDRRLRESPWKVCAPVTWEGRPL